MTVTTLIEPINDVVIAASGLTLESPNGSPILVETLWQERTVLLFFMRHIGCGLCRRELQKLSTHAAQFKEAGCDVAVVMMGDAQLAQGFKAIANVPFPVYGDPSQQVYQAFEFGITTWWNVAGPHILARQLKLLVEGMPYQWGSGDLRRLGGLAIVAPTGKLVFQHVASPIYQYPKWDDVLQLVQNTPA